MKLKRATMTLVGASAVVMAGLVVLPNTAFGSSPHPPTLYVATSGTNVNNDCQASINPCQTVSFALTQAQDGATIKVQAGTYNEQLRITHPVTILGAGSTQTVIEPSTVPNSDTDTDSNQPQFFVIDVSNTTGVNLKDVGINGSAATASLESGGCAQDFVGAYYHDASGSMTNDTVTGIELPVDLFGCQGGLGVYAATDSSSSTHSALSMSSDNVNNYDKNGITCDDPGTACTIKSTTVTGIGSTPLIAQNGIQIWAAGANLSGNAISGNTYDGPNYTATGILIGNPATLSVKNNQVTHNDSNIYLLQDQDPAWVYCGNTGSSCTDPAAAGTTFKLTGNHVADATNADAQPVGSGYGDGIDLDSVTENTTLTHNVADNDPGNGIAFLGATNVVATRNTARNDDNGVYLGVGLTGVTANANTLVRNTVSSSLNDGFLADSSSGGNTMMHNRSQLNANLDVQDLSTGAGTAGTANGWASTTCTTSAPSGLCHAVATFKAGTSAGTRGHRNHHGVSRGAGRSTSARLHKAPRR